MSQSSDFNIILQNLRELKNYYFEIGVPEVTRKNEGSSGVTNAQLMFIHENGSPLRNIPSRPVLQMTIEYAKANILPKLIDNCINAILNGKSMNDVELILNKAAIKIQKYARQLIYSNDGRLAANAISTQRAKGMKVDKTGNTLINHPLFDTGQLARSIICRVSKK